MSIETHKRESIGEFFSSNLYLWKDRLTTLRSGCDPIAVIRAGVPTEVHPRGGEKMTLSVSGASILEVGSEDRVYQLNNKGFAVQRIIVSELQ